MTQPLSLQKGMPWSDDEVRTLLAYRTNFSAKRWVKEALYHLNRSYSAVIAKAYHMDLGSFTYPALAHELLILPPVLEWFGFWSGDGIRCSQNAVGLCNSDQTVLDYFLGIGERYLELERVKAKVYVYYPKNARSRAEEISNLLRLPTPLNHYYLCDRFTKPHFQVAWRDDRLSKRIHGAKYVVAAMIEQDEAALLPFMKGRFAADGFVSQATRPGRHKWVGIAVKSGPDTVFLSKCLMRLGLPKPKWMTGNSIAYGKFHDLNAFEQKGLATLHPERHQFLLSILKNIDMHNIALIDHTERERRVVMFVRQSVRAVTSTEIASATGYSSGASCHDLLQGLARKGTLVFRGKYRRYWTVPEKYYALGSVRSW